VFRAAGEELPKLAARTITNRQDLRAELDRVRSQGWAQIDDELEDGLFAMAVPLRDNVGQMFAALAMVAPQQRIESDDTKQRHLKLLLDGARQLTHQLTSTMPANE
jgi:DNA-binding IclR family transcriptional regulator